MTKDKQIEEMAVVLSDGGCRKCDCDANGRFNCKLLYDAELLYNAGYRKQSEWISVDEALPKKWQKVLVYCNNITDTDFITSRGVWYQHIHESVTHWMPLPEAPKMRKEDEGK